MADETPPTDAQQSESTVENRTDPGRAPDGDGDTNINVGRNLDVGGDLVGGDQIGRDQIRAGRDIIENVTGGKYSAGQIIQNYYSRLPAEEENEDPAPGDPPYKGAQVYDVVDARLFYGREREVAQLIRQLEADSFLAVLGASGVGKSSLVRAGMVPALQAGELLADGSLPPDNSRRWPIYLITPSLHPLESLAAGLTRDSESVTAAFTLADDMVADHRSLKLMARRLAHQAGSDRILLIIDQFEEVLTKCQTPAERQAFLQNLLTAVSSGSDSSPLSLVITMRSDYVHDFPLDSPLGNALRRYAFTLRRMDTAALRDVIEKPAAAGDWEFEPGLVELFLRETAPEPGALALLSRTLLAVWKQRRGRKMTFSGYEEVGGVRGALVNTADAIYVHRLTAEQQPVARNLFLRMTELGEGTQDTRRRAPLAEMMNLLDDEPLHTSPTMAAEEEGGEDESEDETAAPDNADASPAETSAPEPAEGDDESAAQAGHLRTIIDVGITEAAAENAQIMEKTILNRLADARLVMIDDEAAEVTHESLIRQWPRLRQWIEENREGLRIQRQVTADAKAWAAGGEEAGLLYRGVKLGQAMAWGEENQDKLNPLEERFLRISDKTVNDEIAAREAARRRQLETAQELAELQTERAEEQEKIAGRLRRNAQRLMALTAVAVVLAVVAGVVGYYANVQAEAASTNARIIQARELANHVNEQIAAYPQRGLLLGVEAMRVSSNLDHVVPEAAEALRQALANAGGNTLAQYPNVYEENEPIHSLATSPDGQWLAAGTNRGRVLLWDRSITQTVPIELDYSAFFPNESQAGVLDIIISPDNFVYASIEGNVILSWDLFDLSLPPLVISSDTVAYQLSLAANESWLVSGGDDGNITVRPTADPLSVTHTIDAHTGQVLDVTLSPDGRWLVSTGEDTQVLMHRMDDLNAAPIEIDYHNEPVFAADISPDGRYLVTGGGTPPWISLNSFDAVSYVWELNGDLSRPVAEYRDHTSYITDVGIDAGGRWLVTTSDDQTARLYDLNDLTADSFLLRGHENAVTTAAFASDVEGVITGSEDNTIREWRLSGREGGLVASPTILHSLNTKVTAVAVSADERWTATAAENGMIRLILIDDENLSLIAEEFVEQGVHATGIHALAFTTEGQRPWLAGGGDDGEIYLWDLTVADPLDQAILLGSHTDTVTQLVFDPAGRWLLSGGADGQVLRWDLDALGAEPLVLGQWTDGYIHDLLIADTGQTPRRLFAAVGMPPDESLRTVENQVAYWSVDQMSNGVPDPEGTLTGHLGAIESLSLHSSGDWLATGSGDRTVRIWSVHNNDIRLHRVLSRYPEGVRQVDFTRDGRWLVVAGWDEDVYVWDTFADFSSAPSVLRGHDKWVSHFTVTPDSRWLITAGYDGTVRLWDLELLYSNSFSEAYLSWVPGWEELERNTTFDATKFESIVLDVHQDSVEYVAASPSSDWFVTGGRDGLTLLWSLENEQLIDLACRTAGRNLRDTQAEWQAFFPDEPYRATCEQFEVEIEDDEAAPASN